MKGHSNGLTQRARAFGEVPKWLLDQFGFSRCSFCGSLHPMLVLDMLEVGHTMAVAPNLTWPSTFTVGHHGIFSIDHLLDVEKPVELAILEKAMGFTYRFTERDGVHWEVIRKA